MGIATNTEGQYESGKTFPDARYLIAVAKLGVDVHYVLFGQRMTTFVASLEALSEDELAVVVRYRESNLDTRGNEGTADRPSTLISELRNIDPKDRDALLQLLSTA